jgi:hypothetical protein
MILDRLQLTAEEFERHTGWQIKPEGACKGQSCVPLPSLERDAEGLIELTVVAQRLGMPIARDEAHGQFALGPRSGDRRVLDSARMPDLVLSDFNGKPFDFVNLRGRRVVLITWASWCGCRFDLPEWQALHEALSPTGVDIVTVAIDSDVEAARPFHEAAAPTHPSLVDPAHLTSELLGMTNVPFGVWFDETGTIVRPAEPAFGDPKQREEALAPLRVELSEEQLRLGVEHGVNIDGTSRYSRAALDWARHGAGSRYVLSEQEVIARSRPRPWEFGLAAAQFELAQHLHRAGYPGDAEPHFREAHRLDPTNWTYYREALALADPDLVRNSRELIKEVATIGAEHFYPPLDL